VTGHYPPHRPLNKGVFPNIKISWLVNWLIKGYSALIGAAVSAGPTAPWIAVNNAEKQG
jgi:hypothetical protein